MPDLHWSHRDGRKCPRLVVVQEAAGSKNLNVPISHKAGKLGIAVAGQQLDTVSSHGGGNDGERECCRLSYVTLSSKAKLFRTKWRARAMRRKVPPRGEPAMWSRPTIDEPPRLQTPSSSAASRNFQTVAKCIATQFT